jgi:hypothetical protein
MSRNLSGSDEPECFKTVVVASKKVARRLLPRCKTCYAQDNADMRRAGHVDYHTKPFSSSHE